MKKFKKTIAILLTAAAFLMSATSCTLNQSPNLIPSDKPTPTPSASATVNNTVVPTPTATPTITPTTPQIPLPTVPKLDEPSNVDASKLLSEDYEPENEYTNPVFDKESTGDPFVMRYNGKYYLYFTSVGVQCWVSDNLISWESCGKVADIEGIPYAPEVYYYNGCFYMYTSPTGRGHYVLRSDSPTGPFEKITDNIGLSIDGTVFIDDDGQWYFYRAGKDGIQVHKMSSPSDISEESSSAAPDMNGWTEGPSVIKYNGVYYLTYCGNDYRSPGYRINYAYSTESPTEFIVASNGNPLLVDTNSIAKGLGHNSMVIGPDLDSYYMVYHSMPITETAVRDTHIDRIYFNGTEMIVMAPTINSQAMLKLPQVYSYFKSNDDLSAWKLLGATLGDGFITVSAGGKILTNDSFGDKYTAELNVLSISGGMAGAIFGYTDENNYGVALFAPDSQELIVRFTVCGETTEQRFALTKSFGEDMAFDCLQKLTVVRDGKTYRFCVNNITLGTAQSELSGGAFGAYSENGEAQFGFAAINPYANQSSTKEFYKPAECYFHAETCIEDELTFDEKYNAKAIVAKADSYFNYKVNTAIKGNYDIAIKYYSDTNAEVSIYQNGSYIGSVILPASNGEIATAVLSDAELNACYGIITIRVSSGEVNLLGIEFDISSDEALNIDADNGYETLTPLYQDIDYVFEKDSISISAGKEDENSAGKLIFGNYDWNNYSFEAKINFTLAKINGSLLVRASNPSTGSNSNDATGYYYYQGYSLSMTRSSLKLIKVNYGAQELTKVSYSIEAYTEYDFRIDVIGARILVYINDELIIDYVDPEPFLQGGVGLSVYGSERKMQITDVKVTAIK